MRKGWNRKWFDAITKEPNDGLLQDLLATPEACAYLKHHAYDYPTNQYKYSTFSDYVRFCKDEKRIETILKSGILVCVPYDALLQALYDRKMDIVFLLHKLKYRFQNKDIPEYFGYLYFLWNKTKMEESIFLKQASYYLDSEERKIIFDYVLTHPFTFESWVTDLFYQTEKRREKACGASVALLALAKRKSVCGLNKDVARLIVQHMREPNYVFHKKWKPSILLNTDYHKRIIGVIVASLCILYLFFRHVKI
jgi:hypothetical protein